MSKGSRNRIKDQAKFNKNFDKIFNKESNLSELNIEFACYCNKIQEIRDFYGLSSIVYSQEDREEFIKAFENKYYNSQT